MDEPKQQMVTVFSAAVIKFSWKNSFAFLPLHSCVNDARLVHVFNSLFTIVFLFILFEMTNGAGLKITCNS